MSVLIICTNIRPSGQPKTLELALCHWIDLNPMTEALVANVFKEEVNQYMIDHKLTPFKGEPIQGIDVVNDMIEEEYLSEYMLIDKPNLMGKFIICYQKMYFVGYLVTKL